MNIRPPMDPNAAPLDVIHKRRLASLVFVVGFLSALGIGSSLAVSGVLGMICFGLAGVTSLGFLFFEIQSVEFFPTYISINYILRKRRIERADIDFVSMETRTSRRGGIPVTTNYVRMKPRSGRKIDLNGFGEDTQTVYEKLKASESTNEEFLRGR